MPEQKRRFAGGKHSLQAFSRLLGLDRPGLPCRISAAKWIEDHLELQLAVDPGDAIVLVIEKGKGESQTRSFLSTDHLDIWYQGDRLPEALDTLLDEVVPGWSELTIERLEAVIAEDPDRAEVPELPVTGGPGAGGDIPFTGSSSTGPDEPADAKYKPVEVGTWDSGPGYADFLATDVLDLMPFESIEASNPFVRISHSDLECICFSPQEKYSNLNLVDFTWITDPGEGPQLKANETTFCTDLTEDSIIMGCNRQVCEVLDHVLAQELGKPIVFTNTCLPATTGEDVMSVLKRYQADNPLSVISHDRASTNPDDDIIEPLLVTRRQAAEETVSSPDPGSVNLVGFPRDQTLKELEEMLLELGIRINTAVLPEVAGEDMDRFPRAALNVFLKNSVSWRHFHEQLAAGSRIQSIFPPGPFGIAGTRAFLEAIVEALGLQGDPQAVVEKYLAPHKETWERLGAAAPGCTVGLVLRSRDIDILADPQYTGGVPVVAMLEEMGFGLEILIQADDQPEDQLMQKAADLLEKPERCRLAAFDSLAGMREALRKGAAQAVLSNYTFDWRLTEAGKNRFSLRHFEKGIAGAVRTLEQITGICRIPFYRQYADAFRRTDMGLRLPRRG